MIKLLRIDDRLIHGQVAMAWTKSVGADHIIVVDDESANDKMKKMILTLAKPAATDLSIVSVRDFLEIYEKSKEKKLMIITGSPKNAKKIVNAIGKETIESINLGGLRYSDGKKKVNEFISLSLEDEQVLDELKEEGIPLVMQATPTTKEKLY